MAIPGIQFLESENFTVGRCGPNAVLAVVLHEYDGSIEQLSNQMQVCPQGAPLTGAHSSFHYGVGGNVVHQYVGEANTAIAHGTPPAFAATWPLPTVHPGVNPDCYTINIAVATGQGTGGSGFCFAQGNAYGEATIKKLVELVCDILKRYNLAPSTSTLIRHLSELADFPWAQFVLDVTTCYNTVAVTPANDYVCDALAGFPPGTPTVVVGLDAGGACVKGPVSAGSIVTASGIQGAGTAGSPIRPNFDALPVDAAPTITGIVASTTAQPDGALVSPASIVCAALQAKPDFSGGGADLTEYHFPIFNDASGICEIATFADLRNSFRIVQPLVVGLNVVNHNLGYAPVMVEVRDDATGAEVAVRVTAETATSCTIDVPVALAAGRVTIR